MYTHAKRSHMHVEDPVVHVRVRWTMETTKLPRLHSKVSESLVYHVEVRHNTEEDKVHTSL